MKKDFHSPEAQKAALSSHSWAVVKCCAVECASRMSGTAKYETKASALPEIACEIGFVVVSFHDNPVSGKSR